MQVYQIFGRTVPAYQLSIAVLSATALGGGYAVYGRKPKPAPEINAGSSEEEKFILDYIKKVESEEKH